MQGHASCYAKKKAQRLVAELILRPLAGVLLLQGPDVNADKLAHVVLLTEAYLSNTSTARDWPLSPLSRQLDSKDLENEPHINWGQ